MLRIAVVFAVLMALATGRSLQAATPSSAPVSRPDSGPGITVTEEGSSSPELSEAPITFSKSLSVTLTVNSTVNAAKCTVTDLTRQWATLQLIDPNGSKFDFGFIDNSDLYGSQDCTGHHSRTKSFTLPAAKGNYVLVLVVTTLVNRRPKSGPYFVFPSIRIEADGQPALDRSFPSYGDEAQITQVIPIVSK